MLPTLLLIAVALFGEADGLLSDLVKHERYRRQTGSSRLGDPCTQNIDCTSFLLYCTNGRCACSSSAVQINNVCYRKVFPGQSGCSYTEQCTSTWPRSTCSNGQCQCPTTSASGATQTYYPAATRDGYVCVALSTSGTANCPTPDYIVTSATAQVNSLTALYSGASTQYSCTAPGACSVTPAGATSSVQDIYDCIQTAASGSTGICCPGRAITCIQAPLSGGSGGSRTRYYYNSVAGTCQTFSFNTNGATAANTNGNNFETLDHCITYCDDRCERGTQQFSGTGLNAGVTCSASSDNCATNYECQRVGSNYLCCGTPEFVCGFFGGRSGSVTPGGPDAGFSSNPVLVSSQTRFFFNPNTASCQSFVYRGSGGNFNNFGSSNDCNTYCEKELCDAGEPLKTSSGQNQRCSSNSDCPTSYTCTSSNSATSIQICCPRAQTICEQARIVGTCTSYVTRYWFNAASGICEQFQYSGCGGNSNNFRTQIECQTACSGTTTSMTCIQGLPYKDSFGRYYQCSGSSNSVGNIFVTTTCPINYECYFDGFRSGCCPTQAYTCSLSSDAGRTCTVATSRWYYDTTTRRCSTFTYYGCDGNSNNFATQELCISYCGVGGCTSGGQVYLESGTAFPRTCSASVTCPSGYVCEPINDNGVVASRCCPTRDTVCSASPVTGNCITSSTVQIERYYFNRVSRTCQTFTFQGCATTGNNFATLAQCQNYCQSAGCPSGDIVFIDPSSNRPRSCSTSLTTGCPAGYTCRYDSLTQQSVCCGSTNAGVCAAGQRAYMNPLSQSPQECLPGVSLSCFTPFQCNFNQRDGKYYCCAPQSGNFCPAGRAVYNTPGTNSPVTCTVSLFTQSGCPNGYTCQTAVPGSVSGYCCTANTACPNGAQIELNVVGNPIPCTIGSLTVCGTGYSCQVTLSGTTSGYCCLGTGGAVQGGCPPGQFVIQSTSGQPCNAFSSVTGCPSGSTCQWSPTNSRYQCCSPTPPQTPPLANSNGCPVTQVAFLEATGQPRICPSVSSTVCPVGYFCQYSTQRQVFQCCGLNGGCPGNQVAQIAGAGSPQQCNIGVPGSCAPGYLCVQGTLGQSVCCSTGQEQPTTLPPTLNCGFNEILFSGACLPRVQPGQSCVTTEQCMGGATCLNRFCTCAPGQFAINGVCSTPTQPPTQPPITFTNPPITFTNPPITFTNPPITQPPFTNPPTGIICPSGQNVWSDNGVPRSCVGNSFGCPATYSCTYSPNRRSYFCCGFGGSTPTLAPVGRDCPASQMLMFPGSGAPVTCRLSPNNCPNPFRCISSLSRRQNVCCRQ